MLSKFLLLVAFAVLYAAPFLFPETWLLAFVALVPLFFCIAGIRNRLHAFLAGYCGGFLAFLLALYWISNVSLLGFLILDAYLAVYTGLFAMLAFGPVHRLLAPAGGNGLRGGLFHGAYLTALWTLLEYARANLYALSFPWALLGLSQWKNRLYIQSAELFGVHGISFLLALSNALAFLIFAGAFAAGGSKAFRGSLLRPLAALVALNGVNMLYGVGSLRLEETASRLEPGPAIAVIQGNIRGNQDGSVDDMQGVIDAYKGLTRRAAAEKPALIVWPENSYPLLWDDDPEYTEQVKKFAVELGIPLILGAPVLVDGGGRLETRNSAFYLEPKRNRLTRYDKNRLVPFGEYVPFFRFLKPFVEMEGFRIADYSPGGEINLFTLASEEGAEGREIVIGMLICFEDTFSDYARSVVNRGCDILVNITNDGLFAGTAGPLQHFQAGVFRAIENRIPVVRATTTGVSGFISAYGRIENLVALDGKITDVAGWAVDRPIVQARVVGGLGFRERVYYGSLIVYGAILAAYCGFCRFGAARCPRASDGPG